jgi:hypothetical protein
MCLLLEIPQQMSVTWEDLLYNGFVPVMSS